MKYISLFFVLNFLSLEALSTEYIEEPQQTDIQGDWTACTRLMEKKDWHQWKDGTFNYLSDCYKSCSLLTIPNPFPFEAFCFRKCEELFPKKRHIPRGWRHFTSSSSANLDLLLDLLLDFTDDIVYFSDLSIEKEGAIEMPQEPEIDNSVFCGYLTPRPRFSIKSTEKKPYIYTPHFKFPIIIFNEGNNFHDYWLDIEESELKNLKIKKISCGEKLKILQMMEDSDGGFGPHFSEHIMNSVKEQCL